MTADERIEKLLNRFGQTISDLPQSTPESYAYKWEQLENVSYAALNWTKHNTFTVYYLNEYLCHLADVIDRMEAALETALRCPKCYHCVHFYEQEWIDSECWWHDEKCSFRVANFDLVGFVEPDVDIEKDNQDDDMLLVGGASGAGMKHAIEKAMKENSNEQS